MLELSENWGCKTKLNTKIQRDRRPQILISRGMGSHRNSSLKSAYLEWRALEHTLMNAELLTWKVSGGWVWTEIWEAPGDNSGRDLLLLVITSLKTFLSFYHSILKVKSQKCPVPSSHTCFYMKWWEMYLSWNKHKRFSTKLYSVREEILPELCLSPAFESIEKSSTFCFLSHLMKGEKKRVKKKKNYSKAKGGLQTVLPISTFPSIPAYLHYNNYWL